jgi:AraC family transcriptional regulator of adaptative response/methylated-DNA-[protein]-cysteine methyltransferase
MQASVAQPYPDDAARWRAVLARDPAADGAFCYAVRTTGVFCRPTCPARRPRRDRVVFFDSPAAARRAGYRPCRRCAPETESRPQRLVAQACALLDTAAPAPSLAALAAAVGSSPYHLHRLFRRAVGLTPRQYAAVRRRQRLQTALRAGEAVAAAQYAAGYGSSRALYAEASAALGMPPARYRAGGRGERIAYDLVDSPLGRLLVAATARGVCALRFGDDAALRRELAAEFPHAALVHDPAAVAPYVAAVRAYLAGGPLAPDVPLDLRGTLFQQRVWAALREIPAGETRSYAAVARALGQPGGARAVARACAANPVAVLVPCHRVVRGDGGLSGYRWGVERKRALLALEGAGPPRGGELPRGRGARYGE